MGLSKELQIGKAGEHLVCADLIMKGFSAFLSDQGLSFDVVVESNKRLLRIQVKTTQGPKDFPEIRRVYRFGIKRAKTADRRFLSSEVDILAFVALDIKQIAYMSSEELSRSDGTLKTIVQFKDIENPGPDNGFRRPKFFQEYGFRW